MSVSRRTPQALADDITRATHILAGFTNSSDVQKLIPSSVLANAHGLMIIRLTRVGLVLSAKRGTGVIIARLPDGTWSAPSGISVTAVGYGHQVGAEVIDSVVVLNYRAAVKAFIDGGGQLQLGVNASLSAGPVGRAVTMSAGATSATHIAATYSYR
ncbi:hypothetical protein BX666DRAFT_1962826 [Dichotomocladium elegans]|nr:hypothetical protein BX666DRAFT_1962826 [Dichotomocladium elegans]